MAIEPTTTAFEQGPRPHVTSSMTTGNELRYWKPTEGMERRKAEDLRYWSERFGVSAEELREAIDTRQPIVKSPLSSGFTRYI
jgi:Protein of unknown function (DUF3606)